MKLVFKENATGNVLSGGEFERRIMFPKIRNLNRLEHEHRSLTFKITEKIDGQNIAIHKINDELIFYSRNQILQKQDLGKELGAFVDSFDWNSVFNAMKENEVIYVEFFGKHKDFDYTGYGKYGLMIFALKTLNGTVTDNVADIVAKTALKAVPYIGENTIQTVESIREMLARPNVEGYVLTHVMPNGEYVAYKAKKRELSEEVWDEEKEKILKSADPPAEKVAKIVCTIAKVNHIRQKLLDENKADDSNAIIPILVEAVVKDVWEESKDIIENLEFKVPRKLINRALEDRVRKIFFNQTLKNSLAQKPL